MKWHKRILKSRFAHRIFVWLLAQYIRFTYLTARKTFEIHPDAEPYMQGEDNAIFAFWHGRMMMMPCLCPPSRPMHVLISQHRDGIFISDVMKEFHFATIAGSTSKNGRAALMAMLRALKAGENIAITPDGPRGPFQTAALGVATAARLSGKPVLPITFYARHHKRFSSWDKMMLVLPFSKMILCATAPIMVSRDADDEMIRIAIESAMNQQTIHADATLL